MGRSFDSNCNGAGPNIGRCTRMRSSSSSASANADACCGGELDIASRSAPSSKNTGLAKRRPLIVGLHQVVRLRQMLLQWRHRAANNIDRTVLQAVMSPAARAGRKLLIGRDSSSSRGPSSASSCEDHERGSGAGAWHIDELLPPVPAAAAGCLAIYVGREHRRYEIPVEHINHPLLQGLLKRSEGEIRLNDVQQLGGGLAIPACETVLFEHLLWMVENHEDMKHLDFEDPAELRELLDFYMHQHIDIAAGEAPAQLADQGALTLSSNSCLQEVNVFHSDVLTTSSTRVSACT